MLVAAHPEISHPAIKKLTIVFMVAPFFMVAPCCLRAARAQSHSASPGDGLKTRARPRKQVSA
jgi:hypothetical protein